jgi:hypothetical protein
VSVCDALGLEQEYIRKKLKHWTPSAGHSSGTEVVSSERFNRRGFATQQINDRPSPRKSRLLL